MRWAAAWSCFWIGHVFSLPLRYDHTFTVWLFWRPYQKFMAWSSDIQGSTDKGPWCVVEIEPAHQSGPEGE